MSTTSRGPSVLTTRVSANDAVLLRSLFGLTSDAPAPHVPGRLVVDAHVPLSSGGAQISQIAREAGVPLLVDPETMFLQDRQHSEAPWLRVPYGVNRQLTPGDFWDVTGVQDLVHAVIEHQLVSGATAVIAPYVHIESPDGGWDRVQAGLWRCTRSYLDHHDVRLPVVAVVALGWRCLDLRQRVHGLSRLWDSLAELHPDEVAVAASKAHDGARPFGRIVDLLALVNDLATDYPVTLWQQGLLGEAGVIAGAAGYECGIGWREKCDLRSRMSQHREDAGGPFSRRPIYLAQLGASVPKRRLELASTKRTLWRSLICTHSDCCPPGGTALLTDARRHNVVARARSLAQLNDVSVPRWQWQWLAQRLETGLAVASALNDLAPTSRQNPQVGSRTLTALQQVADSRRIRVRRRRTA